MDTRVILLVTVIVAVLVFVAVAFVARRRKTEQSRQRFGPKYDRTVLQQHSDLSHPETALADRETPVEAFPFHALSTIDREAYVMEWAAVQRRFIENPSAAVKTADRLVGRAMTDRGYPMTNFEQRAADISASFPSVVQNYRAAHGIVMRHADGQATTEELRQAMVHYRTLFDELLQPPVESSKVHPINQKRSGIARAS